MQKLIIMSGIPGSGKSTRARQLRDEFLETYGNDLRAVILSADDYFQTPDGYVYEASKQSLAHHDCFRRFMAEVKAEAELIIVDNTNTTTTEISPYHLAGESYGYQVTILRMRVPFRVALDRNARGHKVPEHVMGRMDLRFNSRSTAAWWHALDEDAKLSLDEIERYYPERGYNPEVLRKLHELTGPRKKPGEE